MQLLPFQEKAVSDMVRILRERGGVYNAYVMGLGKTIHSCAAVEELNFTSILVICPAVVRLVWKQETKIWTKNRDFSIISYDNAVKLGPIIDPALYDCLILDESHKVKNHNTQRAKAIFTHLWPNIRYKIALSGTPFTKDITDCWTLFSRFAPELFPDYWKFVHRYTNVVRTPFGTKFEGVRNAAELKKLIRSTFFIRETIESVGLELPEKTWQKVPLPESLAVKMTPKQEKEHSEYMKKVIAAFKNGHPVKAAPPVSSATWRREQGLKKIPSILEFSKNLLEQKIPIVLFVCHRECLTRLKEGLKKFNPVSISGDTSQKDREYAVKAFQEEGTTDCFLANIEAAGIGLTLTRSSTVLLGEFPYVPSTIQQAVDRVYRYGAKYPVNIYYFVVSESIEEAILETVIERAKDFKSVLNA